MHAVLLNQPFATETRTLLARMSPAPPGSRMRLIDNAVRSMIAQVLWTRLGFLHVLAAHTSQAALLNWINPTGTAATALNSPTFTIDRGFTGDGAASYIETGIASNAIPNFSQDSAHIGAWNLTSGNGRTIGVSAASLFIAPNAGASARSVRINSSASLTTDDNLTTGHLVAVRRDSANHYSYRNGGGEATAAVGALAPAATTVKILQAATFFTGQVAIAHAGNQISAAEVAALYAIFQNYLRGVGAV